MAVGDGVRRGSKPSPQHLQLAVCPLKDRFLPMADALRGEQPSDPLRVVIRCYPCQQSEEVHHARAGTDPMTRNLSLDPAAPPIARSVRPDAGAPA